MQFLNAVGDLLDLIPALFEYSMRSGQCNVEPGGHGRYQWDMGHCSALIKVITTNFRNCVDLLCHGSALLESSLFMLHMPEGISVKVLLDSCPVCPSRILGPVLLTCAQRQEKYPTY